MQSEKKPFIRFGRDLTALSSWKSQKGVLGSVTFSDSRAIVDVDLDDLISKALAFALNDLKQDRRRPFSFVAVSGYYSGLWEICLLVRVPQKVAPEQLENSLNKFFRQFDEQVKLREVAASSDIAEVMRSSAQLADGWHTKRPFRSGRDKWAQILQTGGGSTNDQ